MFETANGICFYGDPIVGVSEDAGNRLLARFGADFNDFSSDPLHPHPRATSALARMFAELPDPESQATFMNPRMSQSEKFVHAAAALEGGERKGDVVAAYSVSHGLANIVETNRSAISNRFCSPIGRSGSFGPIMTAGVEVDPGYLVDGPPGMYWERYVQVDNRRVYKPVQNRRNGPRDFLSSEDNRKRIVEDAKRQGLFFTNLNAMGITRNVDDFFFLLGELKAAGVPIAFDTNYRELVVEQCFAEQFASAGETVCPKQVASAKIRECFERALEYVTLLLGGREDLEKIYTLSKDDGIPALFQRLHSSGKMVGKCSLIKADERGIYWSDEDGNIHDEAPTEVIQDAHPGGAGDAANGAILYGLANGLRFAQAVRFGIDIGVLAVQTRSLVLKEDELRDLLLTKGKKERMPQGWKVKES